MTMFVHVCFRRRAMGKLWSHWHAYVRHNCIPDSRTHLQQRMNEQKQKLQGLRRLHPLNFVDAYAEPWVIWRMHEGKNAWCPWTKNATKNIMTQRASRKTHTSEWLWDAKNVERLFCACVLLLTTTVRNNPNADITVYGLHLHANSILTSRLAKTLITIPAIHQCATTTNWTEITHLEYSQTWKCMNLKTILALRVIR